MPESSSHRLSSYLSRYIMQHKDDYYELLIDVTKNENWEPWILYMLEAVRETSLWTLAKINAIRNLVDMTVAQVKGELPKIYSRELVDEIFMQPYCRIENLVQAGVAKHSCHTRTPCGPRSPVPWSTLTCI